jgi:mRNA interferase RelE/StbE
VKATFRRSFERDLRAISDRRTLDKIRLTVEAVERAQTLGEVPNLQKITGAAGFFRVRIGDYRVGIAADGDTVEFVRVLHRRDIYRHFP